MASNEAEKEIYFTKLEALIDSSDEEYASNDAREILRHSKKTRTPLPSSFKETTPEITRSTATFKKPPKIVRTISAPIPIAIAAKNVPPLRKRSSLHQSESLTPLPEGSSATNETPAVPNPRLTAERRTNSDPTIGSAGLVLPYSIGIKSMLGGKRKNANDEPLHGKKKSRKEVSIKLVPEDQRIFKDFTFYYIPPDDTAPLRRIRITKAREHGVNWTKELIPTTTHIVVDKHLTYDNVMKFLKLETLPDGMIMVNDQYSIDCISSRFLLDPIQKRYSITNPNENKQEVPTPDAVEDGYGSLQLKAAKPKAKKGDYVPPDQTPERSQSSTHIDRSKQNTEIALHSSSSVWPLDGRTILERTPAAETPDDSSNCSSQHIASPRDELDEAINEMRATKDLPLDDEEDEPDSGPPSRDEFEASGSEEEARRRQSRGKPKTKRGNKSNSAFYQENFSCMKGGTGVADESNPNIRTIEILQAMADYYVRMNDHWRQTAYRKAIGTLKRMSAKVSTYEQAISLPTIGDRIATKIEEIVITGRLRRLDNTTTDPRDLILQSFTKVYGIGLNKAWEFVLQGHKTLDDLKARADLTANMRLGIEHYNDFLTRIPRDEVTALGSIVKTYAAEIDPNVEIIIGGSYRRGAINSGDIDCLVTRTGTSAAVDLLPFLKRLVDRLTGIDFLTAALAVSSEKGSGSKWHGCCVLPGVQNSIWRRIDFLLVPQTELGAALIYWTGDDIFNRSMRLLSGKKGWRLNQRGLDKDVMRGQGRVKVTDGSLMEGADERKIFALLGVPWRPPNQRICH